MDRIRQQNKHPIITSGIVIFAFIYMFFYQLAYPFNPAIFLYAIFGLCVLLIVLNGKVILDKQALLLALIVAVSCIGAFYTSNSSEGIREAVILAVMLVFLLANRNSEELRQKLEKMIDVGSALVLFGVVAQFILRDSFNAVIAQALRSDCMAQLMHSYSIDKAFAGFSAYTVDAAFFAAIVFGTQAIRLAGLVRDKKNIALSTILTALSFFVVFLTSKRGIMVGMVAAIFLTMVIMRKISKHMTRKILTVAVLLAVVAIVAYAANEAARKFLNRFLIEGDWSSGRIKMYMTATEKLFQGNFMIGFGTGATYELYSAGLHNIYLQILYDHGVLGLIPYLAFFIYNLYLAYHAKKPRSVYIQIMMLLYGLFGNPIYSNMIFMTYLVHLAGPNEQEAYA